MSAEIDEIREAWLLAARQHASQHYYTPVAGETLPYLVHLGMVTLEAQEAVRRDRTLDVRLILLCAILHDVLEDTDLTPSALAERFGEAVLAGVRALTKNDTLPDKAAQMTDSLRRIRLQPREVAVVKLCDRIVNLAPPPAHWKEVKVTAYRKEAELILRELGGASTYLRQRLAEKIAGYGSNHSA
ncbi:MAG: HD domain-containing protein [Bacteroidota bacterium]